MLDRVRAFFSLRVRNREIKPGSIVDTRFGKAEVISGAVNLRLLDTNQNNSVARNGSGFTINLSELH